MKKKLILVIFTCVYALAVAAGFLFAKTRSAAADPIRTPAPQQSNWVLVRIDDMTAENPRLVSVWVMLSSFTSGPQVFFKPLFSTEWNNARSSELALKFSVNPDRSLNSQFLTQLNRINIQRSGLVILDNEGFQNFTAWFAASSNSQQAADVSPALWRTISSGSEAQSYQRICAVLQAQNRGKSTIMHWNELAPNHFILHPNLDPFAHLWDQLLSSSTSPNCTVISGQ